MQKVQSAARAHVAPSRAAVRKGALVRDAMCALSSESLPVQAVGPWLMRACTSRRKAVTLGLRIGVPHRAGVHMCIKRDSSAYAGWPDGYRTQRMAQRAASPRAQACMATCVTGAQGKLAGRLQFGKVSQAAGQTGSPQL